MSTERDHQIARHVTAVVLTREALRATLDGPIRPCADVYDAARAFVEACEAIPTHLRAATIGEPALKEPA